jgi:hypothetical protein
LVDQLDEHACSDDGASRPIAGSMRWISPTRDAT